MKSYERPAWLKSEGVYIQRLEDSYWQNDYGAGQFGDVQHALEYLQTHLDTYALNKHLLICGVMFQVRDDGLYQMSDRHGWQKFEGVRHD